MAGHYQISGETSSAIPASIERGIDGGRLRAGATLPPVRDLAIRLGVAGGTVAAAYKRLRDRGLLATDGRRGTTVRPAAVLDREMRTAAESAAAPGVVDLSSAKPDLRLLPAIEACLRTLPYAPVQYGDAADDAHLLALGVASFAQDGLAFDDVAVVGGALDGVERALTAVARFGDRVAVEDPCYSAHLDLVHALGLVPEPVPVDAFGLRPVALARALRRGAVAVLATPRAQNPTGASFDATRARELRRVIAVHPHVATIEDDYLASVAGTRLHALAGATPRSVVLRSLSKLLGPDLRIALVAGDATSLARIRRRQALGTGWVSLVLQRLAARLWADPAVRASIAHAGMIYAERRRAMRDALAARGVRAAPGEHGMTLWVPVADEATTLLEARARGYALSPGSRFRLLSPSAVRVCVGGLAVAEAPEAARAIAAAIGTAESGRSV